MSEAPVQDQEQDARVDAALASCPELRPVRALDARTRLGSELAMARAAAAMQRLQDAQGDDGEPDPVDGLEGILDVTDEAIEFLAGIARRPADLRKWAASLEYDVYVPAILKATMQQMELLGKSEGSDGS